MSERAALRLSAGAALLIGLLGLTVALLSGSGAILLDGLFNLCFFATALLTLRVATLVDRPDDDALFAFGGCLRPPHDPAARFHSVFFAPPPAHWWRSRLAAVRCYCPPPRHSHEGQRPTRRARSARRGAGRAPPCSHLRRRPHRLPARRRAPASGRPEPGRDTRHRRWSLWHSAFRLAVPVNMAVRGILALLNRAPRPAVVADMEAAVRAALGELPVKRLWIRAVQPGRTTYCSVHVLVPPGTPLDLLHADEMRGQVISSLAARYAPAGRRRRLQPARALPRRRPQATT